MALSPNNTDMFCSSLIMMFLVLFLLHDFKVIFIIPTFI
ncbi:hypothetical protein AOR13_2920 [Alteromonas stellipolaris LMG 21856]|nr:hypothetical protein AOR13_2920 [Alteromonas stellipolaris LMG 21856]